MTHKMKATAAFATVIATASISAMAQTQNTIFVGEYTAFLMTLGNPNGLAQVPCNPLQYQGTGPVNIKQPGLACGTSPVNLPPLGGVSPGTFVDTSQGNMSYATVTVGDGQATATAIDTGESFEIDPSSGNGPSVKLEGAGVKGTTMRNGTGGTARFSGAVTLNGGIVSGSLIGPGLTIPTGPVAPNTILFQNNGVTVTANLQTPITAQSCSGSVCVATQVGLRTRALDFALQGAIVSGLAVDADVAFGETRISIGQEQPSAHRPNGSTP